MEDYTLDQYLRVLDKMPLPGKRTIYLRSLSDNEMRLRQKAAMLASRTKREELRDESSAAFTEFVAPVASETDENLIDSVVRMSQAEFGEEAQQVYPFVHLPYPDDPSIQETLDVDERRDEHRVETVRKRIEYVRGKGETLRQKLQGLDREQLVAAAQQKVIENQLMVAYVQEYDRQLVQIGTFKDEARKKPFFKSSAEVGRFNQTAYKAIYQRLREINEVDLFALEGFSSTES